jgi:hypothetical protein
MGDWPVLRISLPYIYTLALELEPLAKSREWVGKKLSDVLVDLWGAHSATSTLLNNSVFAPTLRSCRESGTNLIAAIDRLNNEDWNIAIEFKHIYSVAAAFDQFKVALLAELGVLPSYFVTQKEGYDTLTLLDWGERLFPASLSSKVPEAIFDAKEAAKAMAFELPTACAFHVFRATEAVLRRYYTEVTGGNAPPKVRNIGVYIHAMRKEECGDEKILSALKQMTNLHRNPIIHPEAALTLNEAISILGIARSAIDAMLSQLPEPLPTTAAPQTMA